MILSLGQNVPADFFLEEQLKRRGKINVIVGQRLACCGRPAISKGMLTDARNWARKNVDALLPYARRGVPIVGTDATVKAGQTVRAGETVAILHQGSPNLELGWAWGRGAYTLAAARRHRLDGRAQRSRFRAFRAARGRRLDWGRARAKGWGQAGGCVRRDDAGDQRRG